MGVGRLLDFSNSWDLIASLQAIQVLMHTNRQLISLTQCFRCINLETGPIVYCGNEGEELC